MNVVMDIAVAHLVTWSGIFAFCLDIFAAADCQKHRQNHRFAKKGRKLVLGQKNTISKTQVCGCPRVSHIWGLAAERPWISTVTSAQRFGIRHNQDHTCFKWCAVGTWTTTHCPHDLHSPRHEWVNVAQRSFCALAWHVWVCSPQLEALQCISVSVHSW